MNARKLSCIIGGGILLMVLVVIAAMPLIAEYIAFRDFAPAQRARLRAQYEEWRSKKVTLPAGALDVKPYSTTATALAQAFDASWKEHDQEALELKRVDEDLTNEPQEVDLKTLAPRFRPLTPLLDAFAAMVRRPDYLMSDFAAAKRSQGSEIPRPDMRAINACMRLLHLRASVALKDGRLSETLHDTELMLQAAKAEAYETRWQNLISAVGCKLAVMLHREILKRYDQPELLRRMDETQNRIAPGLRFYPDRTTPTMVVLPLSVLRELKRQGIPVELRDLTTQELYGKMLEIQALYLEAKILPAVKGRSWQEEQVQASIDLFRKQASLVRGETYRHAGLFTRLFYYQISGPVVFRLTAPLDLSRDEEDFKIADQIRADFEALRRETAHKLQELEKTRPGAAPPALTPAPSQSPHSNK